QTEGRTLLYDTGARFSAHFDAGSAVVVPTLEKLGIKQVDSILVSHQDLDHRGGFPAIVESIPVSRVVTNEPTALSGEVDVCRAGDQWRWGETQFSILAPRVSDSGARSSNNRSCVLRIDRGDTAVLLPGDIEAWAESALLADGLQAADVLLAPHHGSKTSSTPKFVDAVAPEHVVFATGYRNRFGFPHRDVVQRYRELGAQLWQTDRDGAVVFEWSDRDSEWRAYSFRNTERRFWHHKASASAFTLEAE
ncbi:MAG: ComEC/Rec2 family competence protein, partial [Pseudomonadota bacterium]